MKEHSTVRVNQRERLEIESLVARNEAEKDHWKQTSLNGMSEAPREEKLVLVIFIWGFQTSY